MTRRSDDPLTRAVAALESLRTPKTDPVSLSFWEQIRAALLEAQQERDALLAVAEAAGTLVQAINDYDEAVEAEAVAIADTLGEACVEAEGALVDALYRLRANEVADAEDIQQ